MSASDGLVVWKKVLIDRATQVRRKNLSYFKKAVYSLSTDLSPSIVTLGDLVIVKYSSELGSITYFIDDTEYMTCISLINNTPKVLRKLIKL